MSELQEFKTHPIISVIIPIYNAEKHLVLCIESILSQSFQDFEIILVNDGSTDSSASICDTYASKYNNIKALHQQNNGVSSARNIGLINAQGEWLYFMDADDTIEKETFLNALEGTDSSTDIIQFGFNKLENNSIVSSYCPTDNQVFFSANNFIRESNFNTFTPWTHFIRRSLIMNYKIEFTKGQKYAEDLEFVIKSYACSSKIHSKNFVGYNYYIHPDSAMSSAYSFETAKIHLSVFIQLYNFCLNSKLEIGSFMKSRLQYMLKSYFSYSIKSQVSDTLTSKTYNDFISKNIDKDVLKSIIKDDFLHLTIYSTHLYITAFKIKLRALNLVNSSK